ncbi:chemotaxis protein CheW [Marinilactibacillus sp. XAAS-LB27]|uniref:chemotaxis protein CheW n=1 Tax=unclassified Marinilactibacillus TaxID=2632303 RepID=UPI001CE46933|nr:MULTISPECIES: chemotaxis protein CheW [unclassified Marinilactibacillus]MEC6747099.1 chemotaxis protein CheW [Marinilactibacillus sp. XAAS-LB27]
MQVIVFRLGERTYGFSTDRVEEITTILSTTKVPHAPEWTVGLVNLRGQVMTLVDLDKLLNETSSTEEDWYKNTIIIHTEENPIALKVGPVIGVTDVEENEFQLSGEEESVISGYLSVYDSIVSVIELDQIFKEKEEV